MEMATYFMAQPKKFPARVFNWKRCLSANVQNHDVKELYPGVNIIGLPRSYRKVADPTQINCADRKVIVPKVEYFDENDTFVMLVWSPVLSSLM